MKAILKILFGCSHRRLTFPQAERGQHNTGHCSVSCLDCGTRWRYDFGSMKRCERIV